MIRASRVAGRVLRPHVPVALGRVRRGARLLEPGMVDRGVVHHEVGDHADAALVGGLDERARVLDRAVVGVDRVEVGDVVAAVAQRRGVHRQQPDAVDPQPVQVVELLGQAPEVAGAVAVAVEEAAQVDLVEDGRLEPQRVGLEPLSPAGVTPVASSRWLDGTARARRAPGVQPHVVAPEPPAGTLAAEQVDDLERRRQAEPRGTITTPSCGPCGVEVDDHDQRLVPPRLA